MVALGLELVCWFVLGWLYFVGCYCHAGLCFDFMCLTLLRGGPFVEICDLGFLGLL